jgi:hypothetical protein
MSTVAAEEVLSSPLLHLDTLALETPPETSHTGSPEHKASTDTDERGVDAALLLESADQIDALGRQFEKIASLQAAAFDAKALTGRVTAYDVILLDAWCRCLLALLQAWRRKGELWKISRTKSMCNYSNPTRSTGIQRVYLKRTPSSSTMSLRKPFSLTRHCRRNIKRFLQLIVFILSPVKHAYHLCVSDSTCATRSAAIPAAFCCDALRASCSALRVACCAMMSGTDGARIPIDVEGRLTVAAGEAIVLGATPVILEYVSLRVPGKAVLGRCKGEVEGTDEFFSPSAQFADASAALAPRFSSAALIVSIME